MLSPEQHLMRGVSAPGPAPSRHRRVGHIQTESHVQGMVSPCADLSVTFLLRAQSGQASCPKGIRCSGMSTWKMSFPPLAGKGYNSQLGLTSTVRYFYCRWVAGLESPAPPPHWDLGFLGARKCPRCPQDLCAKTGHRKRTR